LGFHALVGIGKNRKTVEGYSISNLRGERGQIHLTVKHRFSLAHFGQKTAQDVHRCLILSLLAFLLSFLGSLSGDTTKIPNWGQAVRQILELFFPHLLVQILLREIERLQPLLQRQGINIQVSHPLLEH